MTNEHFARTKKSVYKTSVLYYPVVTNCFGDTVINTPQKSRYLARKIAKNYIKQ